MKIFLKIALFFSVLFAGILYVDYSTNKALGQDKITVIDYAGEQILNFLQKIKK